MQAALSREAVDRAPRARQRPEAEYQAMIVELAGYTGWLCYHTLDSVGSEAGFPDLVLVHPERGLLFLEVKAEGGRVAPAQAAWIGALRHAGVRAHVVFPADWEFVGDLLNGRAEGGRS